MDRRRPRRLCVTIAIAAACWCASCTFTFSLRISLASKPKHGKSDFWKTGSDCENRGAAFRLLPNLTTSVQDGGGGKREEFWAVYGHS